MNTRSWNRLAPSRPLVIREGVLLGEPLVVAVLAAGIAGFLAGRLLWLSAGSLLRSPTMLRANYRDRHIPTAAGLILVLAALLVEAGRTLMGAGGLRSGGTPGIAGAPLSGPRPVVLLAVVGFGLLGLVDDLVGDGNDRGFRGHLTALARGRVTTGVLKLAGGAAVALVAVASLGARPLGRLLADAALVALAANLGNLFDRAPGRVVKVSAMWFVVVVVAAAFAGQAAVLAAPAVVVGAGLALLGDDLRERLMMGDTGANVLGAMVGLGVGMVASAGVRSGVLVVVLALNVAGELFSFSRVIDSVGLLRAFDQAGRLPPDH